MLKLKFNILLIILILTFIFSVGSSKVYFANSQKRIDNKKTHGTILRFDPSKCNGCWGWVIKIGQDTIKTDSLPLDTTSLKKIKYPQPVNIMVGEIIAKHHSVDYDYYRIEFVELISNDKCSDLIWYRFVGGRPNTYFIRAS